MSTTTYVFMENYRKLSFLKIPNKQNNKQTKYPPYLFWETKKQVRHVYDNKGLFFSIFRKNTYIVCSH